MTATQVMLVIRLVRLVSEMLKGKKVSKGKVNEALLDVGITGDFLSSDDFDFVFDIIKAIGGEK